MLHVIAGTGNPSPTNGIENGVEQTGVSGGDRLRATGRVSDPPLRWRMEFAGEVCPVREDNGILVGVGEKWV